MTQLKKYINHRLTGLNILKKETLFLMVIALFAILMVGLAVFGAFQSYSPVPFWDEWDGRVQFNQKILSGNYNEWWAQHNEHRILLARILFWVDSRWFGDVNLLLIPIHYLFIAIGGFIFLLGLRSITEKNNATISEFFIGTFLIAWLFSWSQHENLIWGFQSQFFLAQLLPLLALYFLVKSIEKNYFYYYIFACVFGVASAGTMANGILVLPLMLFYMIIMRQRLLLISIIALLAVGTSYLYFHGYHSPSQHGSVFSEIKNHPVDLLNYMLFYIGNPFYYLFGKGLLGKISAAITGLFLIGSFAYFFMRFLSQPKKAVSEQIFLFFIAYIIITAFITGAGRLIFGKEQAFSSRYVTPNLMAWASLLLLYSRDLVVALNAKNKLCISLFSILMTLLIITQSKVLQETNFKTTVFNRNVAALALTLQIHDSHAIHEVYPSAAPVLNIARLALHQHASVFGVSPFKDIAKNMGKNAHFISDFVCQGAIDTVEPIEGEKHFLRIHGWLFNSRNERTPKLVEFLNGKNKVIGYAFTGLLRSDVAKSINLNAAESGFSGYIEAQYLGGHIVLEAEKPACTINLNLPAYNLRP